MEVLWRKQVLLSCKIINTCFKRKVRFFLDRPRMYRFIDFRQFKQVTDWLCRPDQSTVEKFLPKGRLTRRLSSNGFANDIPPVGVRRRVYKAQAHRLVALCPLNYAAVPTTRTLGYGYKFHHDSSRQSDSMGYSCEFEVHLRTLPSRTINLWLRPCYTTERVCCAHDCWIHKVINKMIQPRRGALIFLTQCYVN
jgi:hypothetical protein